MIVRNIPKSFVLCLVLLMLSACGGGGSGGESNSGSAGSDTSSGEQNGSGADDHGDSDHAHTPPSTMPEQPSIDGMSVEVVSTSRNAISLRWSLPAETHIDGIELSRDGVTLGRISSDLRTYTDSNLNVGQTYRYSLRPFNVAGSSEKPLQLDASTRDNTAPVFVSGYDILVIADTRSVGERLRTFLASDADGDALSYRIMSGNEAGYFSLNKDSGELSVQNSLASAAGQGFKLLVEASDGFSVTATELKIGVYDDAQTGLLRQFYDFSSTVSSIDGLKNHTDFPGHPTSTSFISGFDAPRDVTDTYGQSIQGYLIPPVSGEYTFWLASDDNGELNLSTDTNPDNQVTIANLDGSSSYQQWDRYASQQSEPVYLEAGKPYYIRALMVEKSGGDHLSVAWQGPDLPRAVISGDYLRPALDLADPTAPTKVRAIKTAADAVLLQWESGNDDFGVAEYRIYDGDTQLAATTELSATVAGLTSDTLYRFRVVTVDGMGNESRGGQVVNVVINDYLAPFQPTGLIAHAIGTRQVSLSWQPSGDDSGTAVLYRIYQDDVVVGTSFDTQYLIKGLEPGSDYAFSIEAVDHVDNVSAASDTLRLTTTPVNPNAPTFDRATYHFAVAASAPVGTDFGTVLASDPNNLPLKYALISGNDTGTFAISADGELSTAVTFDASRSSQYPLTVRVSNANQSTEIDVLVSVLSDPLMAKQGAARELWSDQSGGSIADLNMTGDPALSDTLNDFETPSDIGNNYGQRVRALLRPSVSGSYSFWLASDDSSELYLSRDSAPDNAELIAKLEGWTQVNNWKDSTQIKKDIQLKAGHLYYIEARHKEGGGSDHLSVAWRGGNITDKTLLTGDYLINYHAFDPAAPPLQSARQSGFDNGGDQLRITFTVTEQNIGQPISVYYGLRDGGTDTWAWQQSLALGVYDTAGQYTVELPGIEAGQSYSLRTYVSGELAGGWSGAITVGTVVIDEARAAREALPERIDLTVNINGEYKQVELHKHSVRSPNFRLWTFDDRRPEQFEEIYPLPEVRTYRGIVSNDNSELISAVVDVDNMLHMSAWTGNRRSWQTKVDISDQVDPGAQGIATSSSTEIIRGGDIPAAADNRLFVPQPRVDFYNNLARVGFIFKSNHINQKAEGNLINALAIIEVTMNELDFGWAQKTGLRWDTRGALIEFHGESGDSTQPGPEWTDAANFSGSIQSSSGAYCWGGGDWVGCVGNYSIHGAWMHEVGHNFGLGHGEAVDVAYHAQSMEFQLSSMQSRETLKRLQTGSRFKRAEPIAAPMLPAAFKDYITVYQNGSGSVAPLANDYDVNGDTLSIATFDAVTQQGGTVSQSGNTLYYTPPANFVGNDQFSYTVTDGQLVTTGPVQIQVLPNGLAGYWSMDQFNGNAVVDESGYGHDLIATNKSDASALTGNGVQGQGFSYPLQLADTRVKDAIGDTLLEHTFDPGQQSFSASMWFQYSNASGKKLLMGKSNSSANNMPYGGWEVRTEEQDLVLEIRFRDRLIKDNRVQLRSIGAIADNSWHQVVMVIDREQNLLKGYLDGVLFGSAELPASDAPIMAARSYGSYSSGAPFKVGGHTSETCDADGNNCTLIPGQAYDNLRVYHRALSDSEVSQLYTNQQ